MSQVDALLHPAGEPMGIVAWSELSRRVVSCVGLVDWLAWALAIGLGWPVGLLT